MIKTRQQFIIRLRELMPDEPNLYYVTNEFNVAHHDHDEILVRAFDITRGHKVDMWRFNGSIIYDEPYPSILSGSAVNVKQPDFSPDPNVEKNRELLLERSRVGLKKYGFTTADNPLTLKEWLQHALEECLDQANYLQAAITECDRQHGETAKGKDRL